MIAYKFTDTDNKIDTTINFDMVKQKCNAGYHFGLDHLKQYGIFKLTGRAYDLRAELKHYVYNQYGIWQECYAPNRTLLRKSTHGRINKILEIK